mmetsp:Transcript_72327/g.207510  ORF Transcript_72327/g.207510 Transcript_72327/m.207510 type:complete len:291 (+) Transcript_72327:410-1282(+)
MCCRQLPRSVAGVEPLEHGYEGGVAPLLDLDLGHVGLCEAAPAKHSTEVLALGYENGLVRVDLLALHHECDIAEIRAVQQLAHVLDERVHRDVVQGALLQPAHVEYVQIVQPLVSVEATEDVDPLRADQRSTVPLAARRRVRGLRRPRRTHPLAFSSVQDVQLVGAPLAVVAAEEKYLVTDQVRGVAPKTRRRRAEDLRLQPLQLLRVKDVQICQVLVATVATEQVKLRPDQGHGVSISRLRQGAAQRRLHPRHGLQINDVHIVEALCTVVATEHVELMRQPRQRVAGAR